MRGSKDGNALIKSILDRYRANPDAFHMFTDVLSDSDDFSRANHLRILPFYKQKFFLSTFPTLMKIFQADSNDLVLDAILR